MAHKLLYIFFFLQIFDILMIKIIHVFYTFMHTSLFHIGVVNRYKYYCKIITRFRGGSIFVGFVWTSHQRINLLHELINQGNRIIIPFVYIKKPEITSPQTGKI